MIVSNDIWLHGFTMFYYRTGCEDVTLDLTFRLLYPRMDTDSPFQSISHIFHISMNLALPTARTLDIILWYSMSCYCVANWKIAPAAKMWLCETICFQHVFNMSCTLDIKSALAAHTFSLEVVLENGPYLAPSLDQGIYAPKEWNLGKQRKTAMASLVGLKVQPLGPSQRWFQGLIVCTLDSGYGKGGVEVLEVSALALRVGYVVEIHGLALLIIISRSMKFIKIRMNVVKLENAVQQSSSLQTVDYVVLRGLAVFFKFMCLTCTY